MKKIIVLLLTFLLIIGLFTGCKKEVTSADLMKKYGDFDGKYKEPAEVWVYGGKDIDDFGGYTYYNTLVPYSKQIRFMEYRIMDLEQFNRKAQTELMAGDGPDMLMSTNPDLLGDVNKAALNGAFMSWDKLMKDWDKDQLFPSMLNGARSVDGNLYVFPMAISTTFIVTTKSKMEAYGLTKEDFSDFYTTTDTILRLYESTDEDTQVFIRDFDYMRVLSDVIDYNSKKITLDVEKMQETAEKWEQIYTEQKSRKRALVDESYPFAGKDTRVLEIMDSNLFSFFYGQGRYVHLKNELVLLPVNGIDGKMFGDIEAYALISSNTKRKDAVNDYLKYKVLDRPARFGGFNSQDPLIALYISKDTTAASLPENLEMMAAGLDFSDSYIELLSDFFTDTPMNLKVWSSPLREYSETITEYLQHPETADWEELERSINIYLSE